MAQDILRDLLLNNWQIFSAVALFAVFVTFLKSSTGKGMLGEFFVNITCKLFLDKKTYHLIKDVTLPTEDGTTQIDHIIVSQYGLFVIETKNYTGWIFGTEKQSSWTQQIYKTKHKFQNPLRQNYKHTCTLENMLGIQKNSAFPVIAFVGSAEFITKMPDNVCKASGWVRYVKTFKEIIIEII